MMRAVARGVAAVSSARASSYSCCKKDINLSRSDIQWRGKSFAAPVPSDSSIQPRSGKRIPKHERCAMLESFVNKYRATNAGNFPSISLARQEVGGSFYVIREMLQEMKYKSESILMEERGFPNGIKRTSNEMKKSGSGSSESCHVQSQMVANLSEDVVKDFKADTGGRSLDAVANSNDAQSMPKSCPKEPDVKREGIVGPNMADQKYSQELSETEDLPRELELKEASPVKPTVWGSLKSLAHGIISFLKNR